MLPIRSSLLFFLQICSLRGSQTDDSKPFCSNAECFQQAAKDPQCGTDLLRNFYSARMARAIRDFTTVTVNIDFWNSRHTRDYTGFNVSTSVSVATLTEELLHMVDNPALLNEESLSPIISSIMDQVAIISNVTRAQLSPPEFVCPIPCAYEDQMMGALFAASLTLNILMVLGFAVFLYSQGRLGQKHKRLSNASA